MIKNDYNLARDRVKRNIVPPRRYGQVDLIYFALTVAEEIQATEPRKFKEALNDKENEEEKCYSHSDQDITLLVQITIKVKQSQEQRIPL